MNRSTQLLLLTVFFMGGLSTANAQIGNFSQDPIFNIDGGADTCPDSQPLLCSNGACCPTDSTFYCPQMEPSPCLNPKKLSDVEMKTLSDRCSPLYYCH